MLLRAINVRDFNSDFLGPYLEAGTGLLCYYERAYLPFVGDEVFVIMPSKFRVWVVKMNHMTSLTLPYFGKAVTSLGSFTQIGRLSFISIIFQQILKP